MQKTDFIYLDYLRFTLFTSPFLKNTHPLVRAAFFARRSRRAPAHTHAAPAERLFRDTILPEKFPETGLFVMKNRVFIEFISTKPGVYLFL